MMTIPKCPYCGKVLKLLDRSRVLSDGEYHSRCADKKFKADNAKHPLDIPGKIAPNQAGS